MISGRYTLFTRIPLYQDATGAVFAEELWGKDLLRHFDYIADLGICCPVEPFAQAPEGAIAVPALTKDHIFALRKDGGWGSVLRNLLPNFRRVIQAVRRSQVVHSGGAGWAFPLSFYILLVRPFAKFQWFMVIESSFWMKPANKKATPREWLAHHLHAWILKRCLKSADARLFTQEGYRRFFKIGTDATLVSPAVWVDEAQIISDAALDARLTALPPDACRILFPARLVADKGSDIVIAAIQEAEKILAEQGQITGQQRLVVDFVGAGPLAQDCKDFAAQHQGQISVHFLEPVAYGRPFFDLLQAYHAVVLANRQHEQPRVIFDAFSQGVPVIATSTSGVCDVTREDENALLYAIDDVQGLARHMIDLAQDPVRQKQLSQNALRSVHGYSHKGMHQTRAVFLQKTLQTRA